MSGLPPVVDVSGGVAGIEAQRAAIYVLAQHLDEAGDRARGWAAVGPRTVADPDLVGTAPFSPVTFAAAEAAVLRATVGAEGALGRSVAWEVEAVAVRAAVDHLVAADHLAHDAVEVRDYALGRVLGGLALGTVAAVPAGGWGALGLAARLGALDGVAGTLQDQVSAHPDAVQTLFNAGGGLLDSASWGAPQHPDTESAAGAVAGLYDDGSPAVRPLDPAELGGLASAEGVAVPDLGAAPTTLAGLVSTLGAVAGLSRGSGSPLNGTVAVSTFRAPDGTVRHVVYVPGTDDMATTPWSQDDDVRDMGTNLDLMGGRSTSYGEGVLEAMHQAGIGPDEPVMVVGHSQGGMVAAALAADPGSFDISHVVTAGAPTAQVQLPGDVHALSLENRGDVVPLTDGEPNQPSPGHVTVTFDGGGDGLVGHHDYDRYTEGAAAADASSSPSVVAALHELRASGFLDGGGHVESQVFQVTRR